MAGRIINTEKARIIFKNFSSKDISDIRKIIGIHARGISNIEKYMPKNKNYMVLMYSQI